MSEIEVARAARPAARPRWIRWIAVMFELTDLLVLVAVVDVEQGIHSVMEHTDDQHAVSVRLEEQHMPAVRRASTSLSAASVKR